MSGTVQDDLRRAIPAVDRVLADPRLDHLAGLYGRPALRVQVTAELEALRRSLTDPARADGAEQRVAVALLELPQRVAAALVGRFGGPLRRTLNATGIFLHTNLGRAPLPRRVAESLPGLLDASCDLEFDLTSGRRGERNQRAGRLLTALTGAEEAIVANNAAAALVLVLATLAAGREVVISRGELVEIGGSFRIPEILTAAGARLREVGTTNRVHRGDYAAAVGPDTALVMKVFPSNYRISGFVADVSAADLAGLAHENGVPLLVDEGSGLLRSTTVPELSGHPAVSELIASGADVVVSSGDKLLGGPQAGLLVGRRELVAACRRHPLYRALRPNRMAYAALEGVLFEHLAERPLPLDRLWVDPATHIARLERFCAGLAPLAARRVSAFAYVGGGAAPERPIAGEAVAVPGHEDLLERLRLGDPPVVAYTRAGWVYLDLRTVDPEDDDLLVRALRAAVASP